MAKFGLKSTPEKNRIDVRFTCSSESHLAELKICYYGDTRHAIREAMGQLLEYNHYPPYEEADLWWLVIDCEPSKSDLIYLSSIRERYGLPLTISWPNGKGFKAYPSLPLMDRKIPKRVRARR